MGGLIDPEGNCERQGWACATCVVSGMCLDYDEASVKLWEEQQKEEAKKGNVTFPIEEDKSIKLPPDIPFGKVLDEMFHLYQKKNHDYGDSFSTLFKEFGLIYSVPRIYEKATRLKTLLKAENEVSESVRDTLIDLASYCVMTIVELDKAESNECNNTD